ncbi:hypothetical protein SAMN05421854_11020 [Amycolatopsis rubida]|uniref:Uncharacterized protein n=1 Tax=Amycolatopsis rubida TaxID=112413 RepID=A0A1I5X3U4_9PSEU|nr:hypothetical protein SAMN05421854_11020 [Amycolatopsis rubida]
MTRSRSKCPDKAMDGEFKLNMNSRLTLGPAAPLPGA